MLYYMVRCRKCGWEYGDWQGQCPQCGTPLPKRHRQLTRFLAVGAILVIVIAGYALFTGWIPVFEQGVDPNPDPGITVTDTSCIVQTLPILAIRHPGGTIDLTVQGGGDLALAATLDIRLNGVSVGSLEPQVGAMTTVRGTGGPDLLVVVANSTCGRESVVLQKNL
jgi:hypothetical protein